jgi:two-component system alkaline phosphatase synthesis response regulator PhoP
MSQSNRVLIIADDKDIADLVRIHLKNINYEPECAVDGISGLEKVEENDYALIILDLMLPKLDGLEVCRRIRAKNVYTLILMLNAKSGELDKILGLELGADDYMTKPFSLREHIARIKAIFRRMETDKKAVFSECLKVENERALLTPQLEYCKTLQGKIRFREDACRLGRCPAR